jgi:outer membrane protein assembly factor BamB
MVGNVADPPCRSGRRAPRSGRLVRAVAVLAVTMLFGWPGAASGQAAGDHLMWMYDAAHTGVNPAETVLGTGNVARLRRAWERDDLYVGGGSPVVAGGRVYLGVQGGNGNGWVYALDAATGAARWTADTGTPFPPKYLALAGSRLIVPTVGDGNGLLLALDPATGRRLWATSLTPGDRSDWGFPPTVAGGRIYLGGATAKIYSVDAATGRIVWRSTAATFGPPAVVGDRVYAADGGGALYAKDVTNGVNRWIGNGRVGNRTSAPSVGGGRVFTVNDDGYVNAYPAAGCGKLRCGTLWQARVPGDPMWRSTPAVGKTTIFIGGDNRIDALDAATGRRRWAGLVDEYNGLLTSPTIAHGVIYVGSAGDRLHAFPSAGCGAPTCRPIWSVEFHPDPSIDQVQSPPAVSHGALYATGSFSVATRFSLP